MRHCRPAIANSMAEQLEERTLFAVTTLDVSIGANAARSVRFVDGDGTAVSVSMSAASATIHFAGDDLSQTRVGRDTVVSGAASITGIAVTGASRRSSLRLSASGGDGRVAVGGISADGPLKYILAPQAVLAGTVSTAGPVRRLQVFRTENASVTLAAGAGTSSVSITEAAINTDVTSGSALRRLDAGRWGGFDPGGSITAPSIGTLLTGAFRGDITAGSAAKLDLGDVDDITIQVTGSIGALRGIIGTDLRVDVGGDIKSVTFGWLTRAMIYAGVGRLPDGSTVPTSVGDFARDSRITRVGIGNSDLSGDVRIAARSIGTLGLGSVLAEETFIAVQVVADRINRLTALIKAGLKAPRRPFHLSKLENAVRQIGRVEVRAL